MYFIFLKNNYWHFFQKVGRRHIIGTFFKKLGGDTLLALFSKSWAATAINN
jgi:hypothetical protein